MATITDEDIKVANMEADDRLLYEAGYLDTDGVPTNDGWIQMRKFFFAEKKAELVALVKKVNASKKEEKE